ncbi:MAG: DUF4231 domain-containing protein [Bacillota bacterium]|nr:DUF4231 domain-containing protein [Bacillota bacterium]
MKDRVENVLLWNINKAKYYKNMYYGMSIIIIIINASIPVINQIQNFDNSKLVVSITSAVAGVVASILTLIGIKDKWYRYRKYGQQSQQA